MVADLGVTSWPVVPGVTLRDVKLHGELVLDALSASINGLFGMKASATVAGRTMLMAGDARFANGTVTELHLRVNPGPLAIGAVTIGGDGRCQASLVSAPRPGGGIVVPTVPPRTAVTVVASTLPPRVGTNGPCVQVDFNSAASPTLQVGINGRISAGTVVTAITGTIDSNRMLLRGRTSLGELGALESGGVLYHAPDSQLSAFRIKVREEATTVAPQTGSWRFDGNFAAGKALKGITAPWKMSAGSVDPAGARTRVTWASLSGAITRSGFNLSIIGDIRFSGSTMLYDLVGTSSAKVDQVAFVINPNPDPFASPGPNALHGAIRPVVFALDPSPASGQRNFEQVMGRLQGNANYTLRVEVHATTANVFAFSGTARVFYAEAFDRTSDGVRNFVQESSSSWNAPVSLDLDIDSSTGRACFRWGEPGEFSTIVWGAGC